MARDNGYASTGGGYEVRLKHYHVLVGLPGYIANSNYPCSTLAEAGDMAYQEAESFREAGYHKDWGEDCLGKVVGNKREGYEVLRPSLWDSHEWDVWQIISIADCYEEECFCQQCGQLLYDLEPCYVCGWPLIIEEATMI